MTLDICFKDKNLSFEILRFVFCSCISRTSSRRVHWSVFCSWYVSNTFLFLWDGT